MRALSTQAYVAGPVSGAFADSDMRADTATSLQTVDAEICGASSTGVTCTPAGLSFAPSLVSPWPAATATVWPGDLDRDRLADWCASNLDGTVSCGAQSESAVTTDGAPWMYSLNGAVETVPGDPALTAIADIDGDGAADLCAIVGTDVACARSQGRAFGPLATQLEAPTAPIALWLGDLDGDGRADTCVDLGATIACAVP